MKKLNITGGEWKYSKKRHYAFISGKGWEDFATVVIKIQGSKIESEEGLANAELIADAGTTANKCGLLPSELLKQRDELLKNLIETRRLLVLEGWSDRDKIINQVDEAVNNATNNK